VKITAQGRGWWQMLAEPLRVFAAQIGAAAGDGRKLVDFRRNTR